MNVQEFFQTFLADTGRDPASRYVECFHFELTEQAADALLSLVLNGQKHATSSSLSAYERSSDRLPQAGDLSIVTDWSGTPRCVIETTAVTVLPFSAVTFALCRREGEDACLETWQLSHRLFFTEEGRQLGYEFTEDMPVVFEDFQVVYQK